MPAKKKAATKKNVANKAAKKAAPKTTKKVKPNKLVQSDAEKPATTKTSAAESASKAAEKKVESIHQSRRRKESGNVDNARKHTPSAFTIQDAREMLKKRKKENQALQEEARKASEASKLAAKRTSSKIFDDSTPQQKSKHAAATLSDILGINPSAPKGAKPGVGSVPQKWKNYYDMLIELRDEVQQELKMHSSETLKRSQKEDSGDIVTSSDAGTDNFERDFALSLLSSEQEALKEIQAAIQRIYNGTFGVCEITGNPIKNERLEAVPFTRFSLEGQKQHESSARRRVQRTGAFIHEGSADNLSFGDDDNDN